MSLAHPFALDGQTVLVSGAAGALGSATARACAALGARLILADIETPSDLAADLRDAGVEVRAVRIDTTDRDRVSSLIPALGPLDAYAECSGVYAKGDWLDDGAWDALYARIMQANVRGPINMLRAVLPAMMARGRGRVAIIASQAGRNAGTTLDVEPAYVASKGAVQSLVRYFARQAAPHGVTVNAVAPGPILTPMLRASGQPFDLSRLPMGRMGDPSEVGGPMAFLCSAAAGYTTGAVLDINGGLHFS
ncbi:SDR family oxidoreductase [Pseudooceanicola sp. 216_PA32_1]|uniref:SDR family oxidoreductase n=1 Tax=Pseudooceanicola pacificus TaxID=2676438 RepID=A0A844WFE2_9RHOB|nr:SDR family oxidoreductase [Pseudooceanicola pacificus]MWB78179.1 SDR family oxidoreductase [Pseudooceanicola pacificus]